MSVERHIDGETDVVARSHAQSALSHAAARGTDGVGDGRPGGMNLSDMLDHASPSREIRILRRHAPQVYNRVVALAWAHLLGGLALAAMAGVGGLAFGWAPQFASSRGAGMSLSAVCFLKVRTRQQPETQRF